MYRGSRNEWVSTVLLLLPPPVLLPVQPEPHPLVEDVAPGSADEPATGRRGSLRESEPPAGTEVPDPRTGVPPVVGGLVLPTRLTLHAGVLVPGFGPQGLPGRVETLLVVEVVPYLRVLLRVLPLLVGAPGVGGPGVA